MSKIHILESNNNSHRVVINFATPTGNNAVGLSWKAVGLESGMIGSSVLEVGTGPSNTTQEEHDSITAGDTIEIVKSIVTGTATNTAVEALADIEIDVYKANMSSVLKYYGHTII